jgi:hypothetical protein
MLKELGVHAPCGYVKGDEGIPPLEVAISAGCERADKKLPRRGASAGAGPRCTGTRIVRLLNMARAGEASKYQCRPVDNRVAVSMETDAASRT